MSNHDQPAPPPSNAKEVPIPKINEQELLDSYRGPNSHGRRPSLAAMNRAERDKVLFEIQQRDKEATFNAIMHDLGQPRKMGGVKGPWSYLETIDLMDKNMADGVFGYSKSTIEATLRKHLGLPIVNPQS